MNGTRSSFVAQTKKKKTAKSLPGKKATGAFMPGQNKIVKPKGGGKKVAVAKPKIAKGAGKAAKSPFPPKPKKAKK
jgi:hypothetical protein